MTRLQLLGLVACSMMLWGCQPTPDGTKAPSPSDEPSTQTDGKLLLAQFQVTAEPGGKMWDIVRIPGATGDLPASVGTKTQALANGDEAIEVTLGSQVSLANCVDGQCGCSAASGDIPTWYGGNCVTGQWIGYGKIRLTNLSSNHFFVNPAVVFSNLSPSSLQVFSEWPTAPPPPPGSCASYAATRTSEPLNGSYYLKYADLAPGQCDSGVDMWIIAATSASEVNDPQIFHVSVYVDALTPIQVLNGDFESGLNNWTTTGTASVVPEHCSHESDFTCGGTEDGVLPPAASGTMARLLNVDGGASPPYSGSITTDGVFAFRTSSPVLNFDYKLGSREPANFCTSERDDEFYVQARKNGGAWVTLPMGNPPDIDDDYRVSTGDGSDNHDCSVFSAIDLDAVFEASWEPGTATEPQAWTTAQIDLGAAPLSAEANDEIELRFWVVGGTVPQRGASVFLLDNVKVCPSSGCP